MVGARKGAGRDGKETTDRDKNGRQAGMINERQAFRDDRGGREAEMRKKDRQG
jgi:hypothetical protein